MTRRAARLAAPRGRRAGGRPGACRRAAPPSRAAPSPGCRRASRSATRRRRRAAPAPDAARRAATIDHRDAARRRQPRRGRAAAARGDRLRPRALGPRRRRPTVRGADRRRSPTQGVPAARALFHRLLLAEADPPPGRPAGSAVLVARIDRLLEIGALEEAGALIDRAGPDTPELFRRWFDVGLLLDRAQRALRGAAAEPVAVADPAGAGLLPRARRRLERGRDHPDPRRGGRLDPARRAGAAGALPRSRALRGGAEPPPVPEPLTAARLPDARGGRPAAAAGQLPLAFLHADLDEHVPMRTRIDAAERLVLSRRGRRAGALRRLPLRGAGGLGRASGTGPRRCRRSTRRSTRRRRRTALGRGRCSPPTPRSPRAGCGWRWRGNMPAALAGLDPAALPPDGAAARWPSCCCSAGARRRRAPRGRAGATPRFAALLAVAGAGAAPARSTATSPPRRWPGSRRRAPPTTARRGWPRCWREGRQGAGDPRRARPACRRGGDVDPPALRAALLTLRLAGQAPAARTIALQTLLAGGGLTGDGRRLAASGSSRRSRPSATPRATRCSPTPATSTTSRRSLRRAAATTPRRAGRDRGLPRRSGRPRHGAGHPGAAAVGDPPALPLRLPRGLARGRPGGADQGAEAAARPARQPQRGRGRPAARRAPRRSAAPRRSGCATPA